MLEEIRSPQDIKKLSEKELTALAAEIREIIIKTVLENGGHLASNLGVVEATIALHRVFSAPSDKILFDVGHQSYAHKLLTGRYERFHTLRRYGGLSGFQNREESVYDPMTEGHCGTSLSAALGIALSNQLQGKPDYTVAVVGDGALTNGMIYEALNLCAQRHLRLIIVINDNGMSISKNIGALHDYLLHVRTSKGYFRFKGGIERILLKIPLLGKPLYWLTKKIKDFWKRIFVKHTFFEDLGLGYIGPVDGHDIKKLEVVLREAKRRDQCCVVHIATRKGKGYPPAEQEPQVYHAVPNSGLRAAGECFSERAGQYVAECAEKDGRICAITAAMRDGVGLTGFSERFPERFFDVGIAEENAVTFAAGLSVSGLKPVLFLYSTFAQRSYDQLLHDISIQKLPLVLLLDRCGIVPDDGVTHQGLFDYPLFSAVPSAHIYAPATFSELERAIDLSLQGSGLSVVRYPKGEEVKFSPPLRAEPSLSYTENVPGCGVVIITYGRLSSVALEAKKLLGGQAGVIKLFEIFPLDIERIMCLTEHAEAVYFLEEGYEEGGVSQKIAAQFALAGRHVKMEIHAVKDFVPHGSLSELYAECGFTPEAVAARIKRLFS